MRSSDLGNEVKSVWWDCRNETWIQQWRFFLYGTDLRRASSNWQRTSQALLHNDERCNIYDYALSTKCLEPVLTVSWCLSLYHVADRVFHTIRHSLSILLQYDKNDSKRSKGYLISASSRSIFQIRPSQDNALPSSKITSTARRRRMIILQAEQTIQQPFSAPSMHARGAM